MSKLVTQCSVFLLNDFSLHPYFLHSIHSYRRFSAVQFSEGGWRNH